MHIGKELNISKWWYDEIVKRDLVLKMGYKNPYEVPEIKKIILFFDIKKDKVNVKSIVSALYILELLTGQKAIIFQKRGKSKYMNKSMACKVTLRNESMYNFLSLFCLILLPKILSSSLADISVDNVSKTINKIKKRGKKISHVNHEYGFGIGTENSFLSKYQNSVFKINFNTINFSLKNLFLFPQLESRRQGSGSHCIEEQLGVLDSKFVLNLSIVTNSKSYTESFVLFSSMLPFR
jgi:hypothetical protein